MARALTQIPLMRSQVPKSKEDVLDHVAVDLDNAEINRVKKHVAEIRFPETGMSFMLTIHKPRAGASKRPRKVLAGEVATAQAKPERAPRKRARARATTH